MYIRESSTKSIYSSGITYDDARTTFYPRFSRKNQDRSVPRQFFSLIFFFFFKKKRKNNNKIEEFTIHIKVKLTFFFALFDSLFNCCFFLFHVYYGIKIIILFLISVTNFQLQIIFHIIFRNK